MLHTSTIHITNWRRKQLHTNMYIIPIMNPSFWKIFYIISIGYKMYLYLITCMNTFINIDPHRTTKRIKRISREQTIGVSRTGRIWDDWCCWCSSGTSMNNNGSLVHRSHLGCSGRSWGVYRWGTLDICGPNLLHVGHWIGLFRKGSRLYGWWWNFRAIRDQQSQRSFWSHLGAHGSYGRTSNNL